MRRRSSSASVIVSSRISRSHERFSPRVDSSVIVTVAMLHLALSEPLSLPGHSARSPQKRRLVATRRHPLEICHSAPHSPCYHAFDSGLHHNATQQNQRG